MFQTLKHDVGEVAHKGKTVISSVGHKGVEDLVSSGTELVVCILSELKLAAGFRTAAGGLNTDLPFSKSKKRLDTVLEVLGQRVGLGANVAGKTIGNVHQSPAAGAGDLRRACQAVEQACDEGLEVHVRVKGFRAEVTDTAERVGDRITDLNGAVLHHANEDRKSLLDKRLQDLGIGAIHDGAECCNCSIPVAPVFVTDVLLDKGQDRLDHITLHALSVELQGLVSSARDVVLIVRGILILSAHGLQEDGNDFPAGDAGKSKEGADLRETLCLCLFNSKLATISTA